MRSPTFVVLTDRDDLDDQSFGTFSRCRDLLRQDPVQAESRADLRAKLSVASATVPIYYLREPPGEAESRPR